MKLTALLLTIGLLHAHAKGLSQTVTFSGKEVPLQQVFSQVEKQTGFVFFYNEATLKAGGLITLSVSNMPLPDFLNVLFNNLPLKYSLRNKTIIVSRRQEAPEPAPILTLEPQGYNIAGIVMDEKSNGPLSGVSVVIAGTNKATQTDEKGIFILKNIEGPATLTFTYIGYEKRQLKVTSAENFLTILMTVSVSELDQAVVQAYGTTSKRLATGNIVKVSGEEIRRQPVMNPLLALQGKVPGMQVTPLSGNSSSPVRVEIRGRNSLNPNYMTEPLYVIDGVPQTILDVTGTAQNTMGVSSGPVQGGWSFTGGQSPLFSLNPKDIESIEVLKDGDATAIYGSRAANGVILITTRRAKPGRSNFSIDVQQGVVFVPRIPRMLNTQEYLEMRKEAFANDRLLPNIRTAPDLVAWDSTRFTDWQREVLGTGRETTVGASFSGGDINTSLSLSTNYTKKVDLYNRDGANQRATFNMNLRHRSLNQKLTLTLSANYAYTTVDAIGDQATAFTLPPNAPAIFNSKGGLNFEEWNLTNETDIYPFSYIRKPNISKTNSLSTSLGISYEVLKGLTASLQSGFTHSLNSNDLFRPASSEPPRPGVTGMATFGSTKSSSWLIEPQLRYTRIIGQGDLTVQIGGSLQHATTGATTIAAMGYTNDELIRSIGSSAMQTVYDYYSQYKYAAFFGRINYNWASKYILTINGRRDGSSRFAPERQFGNFGSAAVAWILSEEEWIRKRLPSVISFLKLRSSYGVTGSDNVGDYQYLSQWGSMNESFYTPYFKYNNVVPFIPKHAVNQQYQWEQVKNIEVAMSIGLLNDRINMELAWYNKRSANQLTQIPTPIYSGFSSVTGNWAATVQNSGLEASVNAALIRKKDFSFSATFNIARNVNKLISYPGIEFSPYATRYRVGKSLNLQYLLHYTGVNPLTGEYTFEDYNKDGRVSINNSKIAGTEDDDRYISIDLNPRYSGGFGLKTQYKTLSMYVSFSFVNQIATHPFASVQPGRMQNMVIPDEIKNNHWKKPGDNADYARYTTVGSSYISGSDRAYIDASYIKMNNISINWTLPEKIIKKAGMQSCTFSLTMQNLFTITKYKIDPELKGLTFNPIPREILCGISFNF